MNPRIVPVLLADITQDHDGGRISLSRRRCGEQPGEYPYYGPEGIIARIDGYAYEGDYILAGVPPGGGPWAVPVNGRFSANTRVHVLSCGPGVDPGFLCEVLNTVPCPRSSRPLPSSLIDLKKLETLELSVPPPEVQRRILGALSSMGEKAALLRDQNRVLYGIIHSLFDRFFIAGPGSPRPLGDLVGYRPGEGPAGVSEGKSGVSGGAVFYNLFLYPREDLHPFFIAALIKNPEFLSYAEGCVESGIGKRRLDGERLMAFEISGPPEGRRNRGAYGEFNRLAAAAEKKLVCNHAELQILQKLRRILIPAPSSVFFPAGKMPRAALLSPPDGASLPGFSL
jgi:hypothetical protein